MGYRCVNCGERKENGSKVYFVKTIDSEFPSPTCSKTCAREKINKDIEVLQNKINNLKNTELIEEIWEE